MAYTNIMVNGLKVPIEEKSTIKNLIEKFFDLRCEFLVTRNAKPIPPYRYTSCKIKENDIFQVVTYCKHCYKIHKRTIFKEANDLNTKKGDIK